MGAALQRAHDATRAGTLRLLALALSAATARAACPAATLDFVINEGDAAHEAYAADIAAELTKLGLAVNMRPLDKDAKNAAMVNGDYDLVFSETWGAPYDPHSYVKSWASPDEAHYSALPTAGIDRVAFEAQVDAVLSEMDETERQSKWTALLSEIHYDVLHVPLWGKRIPSLINNARLSGYVPGAQQYDYPLHKASVVGGGSTTVTVAPGAQTGLFASVGRLDPHSYRPNEFFANNWVYEGLIAYGVGGTLEPALATAWTSTVNSDGGETVRFTLRTGVTFHDGAAFNCAAVKLNFDHVFAEELTTGDWHGWYGLPEVYKDCSCDGETFVLNTKKAYYPLLQELSYIRPLRMLSPTAFVGGAASDPVTQNSCPTGWDADLSTITCAGTTAIAGTGPWKFESRTASADSTDDDVQDDLVVFAANADYWGTTGDIEKLHVVKYADSAAVKAALEAGTLDAVVGAGVLAPADEEALGAQAGFDLAYGELSQNSVIIMNIADADMRQAVVQAIDSDPIIASELNDAYQPTGRLFPATLPYCDVTLAEVDYDLEKAKRVIDIDLLCPADSKKKSDDGLSGGIVALIVILVVVLALVVAFVGYIVMKEKAGEPLFMEVTTKTPLQEKV